MPSDSICVTQLTSAPFAKKESTGSGTGTGVGVGKGVGPFVLAHEKDNSIAHIKNRKVFFILKIKYKKAIEIQWETRMTFRKKRGHNYSKS
jgi:hypothetical protein